MHIFTEKQKTDFIHSQVRFIQRFPIQILVVVGLLTLLVMPYAAKLKLRANFLELLPASAESVKNLRELASHVGGTSFVITVFESPDEETAKQAAEKFGKLATAFKQVEYVDNRTNIPAFQNRKLLFLNTASVKKVKRDVEHIIRYHRNKNNPFFVDLLNEKEPTIDLSKLELEEKVSKIGGFAAKNKESYMNVVLIKPKHPLSDFQKSKILFDEMESKFEEMRKEFKHPVTLGMTGPYRTRYQEYRTIMHDLQTTGTLTMFFLVFVNLLAFRNFRSILYAYLPLAIGTVWIWAFTQATIGYLNLITAFLAAILFGMGGDYTFHILVSFEEDLEQTGDVLESIAMTFTELWNPLWSSMWTTAVVFYAMIISRFEGFRHFGIIAGAGIVISFIIVLYVQPCLMLIGEKYFPIKRKPRKGFKSISKWIIGGIILAGVIFTGYSALRLNQVKFNYDFTDLQATNDDSILLAEKIGNYFGVHLNPVVFMTPDREHATKLSQDLNEYIKKSASTKMDFASSITTHVPREQEEKVKILAEVETLLAKHDAVIQNLSSDVKDKISKLRQQLAPKPFGIDDLPKGIREQYEGKDKQISVVFVYPNCRILRGDLALQFVNEVKSFPVEKGIRLAGDPIIYTEILRLIERDSPIALWISTIVVFLLVLWHFKRLDHVLWVHAPLALGGLWMMGMMAFANVKFNFFNMVIVPSILGVGIDNGIYIFDRYKERKQERFVESMHKSIKGVLLSSATNLSAFGSLMFATHRGMSSLGMLGFFGFLGCLLSSVFFMPALIEVFERKYAHLLKK